MSVDYSVLQMNIASAHFHFFLVLIKAPVERMLRGFSSDPAIIFTFSPARYGISTFASAVKSVTVLSLALGEESQTEEIF